MNVAVERFGVRDIELHVNKVVDHKEPCLHIVNNFIQISVQSVWPSSSSLSRDICLGNVFVVHSRVWRTAKTFCLQIQLLYIIYWSLSIRLENKDGNSTHLRRCLIVIKKHYNCLKM